MQWWMWFVVAAVFGAIVVGAAAMAVRARLTELRMAVIVADEHRKAAERVGERAEKLRVEMETQASRLAKPTGSTIR